MQNIISWLVKLAQEVPVAWFVFLGSMIEEVLAPIPSPLVMLLAGSVAASQESTLVFLLVLSIIGAISKTIGSLIIYIVMDRAEDVVVSRFGKFLGVSQSDTEGLGKYLSKGKRDDVVIFLMRALPVMPTAPVSMIAGLIKINLRTYLIATFLGLVIRNAIYLYLGYTSLGTLESLSEGFDSLEKIGYLILSVIGGMALLWMYRKRKKSSAASMLDNILTGIKRIFKIDL